MTGENPVKNKIINHLTLTGWLVLRINSGQDRRRFFYYAKWFAGNLDPQTAGVLDILAFRPAWPPLAIDSKAPGEINSIRDSQRRFIEAWRQHGGLAIVADCVEDVVRGLDEFARSQQCQS